jgi:hypothetical protein
MEPMDQFIPEEGVIYLPKSMQGKLNGRVEFLDNENMAILMTYVESSKKKCEIDWKNKDTLCKSLNCKTGCSFILAHVTEPTPHCEYTCICLKPLPPIMPG